VLVANLKYAVFGTGFWSQFQIAAWNEVGGVDLVAVYNRTVSKAEAIAKLQRAGVYGDPEELLKNEQLTSSTHHRSSSCPLVPAVQLPVICQKRWRPIWKPQRRWCRLLRGRCAVRP
jgi:hypothetical protein